MKRPIRVAYFIAEYHRLGGGQRVLLELIRCLPRDLIEPVAVFPGEGLCVETYGKAGVRVEVCQAPDDLNLFGKQLLTKSVSEQTKLFFKNALPYNVKVAGVLRRWGIDILHCNTSRAVLLGGLGARCLSIPVVWHMRGRLVGSGMVRLLPQVLSTRIILICSELHRQVSTFYRRKCVTVHDGISEDGVGVGTETEAEIPAHCNGRPLISRICGVVPPRGHHYLVEAARLMQRRYTGPQPCFLFVGATPDQLYLQYLQELIARYQLDNVHFLGWKDNPFPYYRSSTVVVCSSVEQERLSLNGRVVNVEGNEGFPRNVAEAMFLGKPVVTTDIAGAAELVADGTGVVVPQRDAEKIAEALIHLLESPSSRQEMGQRAAERVREHFSTERMVRETVQLYQELMS
jgi:glycosyltransferase involved in cell wall biosynthesis